jgi:hypothetical protein
MAEDLWIDKVTLKKRLVIDESGLVEIVSQRILTPHIKHTDGQYYPIPFSQNIPYYATEPHPSLWMGDQLIKVKRYYQVETTKEQIAEYLKTYLWFRQIEIDNAEYEGKINPPEKPKEEIKKITSLSEAGQIGGAVPKKNPVIIAALQIYFKENPKKLNETNGEICRAFEKKYKGESRACCVKEDSVSWEVFSYDGYIFIRTGKKKEKSIKLSTFLRYISNVKKSIL